MYPSTEHPNSRDVAPTCLGMGPRTANGTGVAPYMASAEGVVARSDCPKTEATRAFGVVPKATALGGLGHTEGNGGEGGGRERGGLGEAGDR